MCGISGLFKLDGSGWDNNQCPGELKTMMNKLSHRGPDSNGFYVDGPIAMGINRLAVMDPSRKADQPMLSQDSDFILIFNGEIYNYKNLRTQLEKKGFSFSTNCDTEVLLALYRLKGEACLSELRGMFAFAVWNKREQSLFVARDRIGEKPLVYYQDDTIFIFSSELPALLSCPQINRKIDPEGVHMAMYYMHSIAPKTVYKNIYKLPPAHHMRVTGSKTTLQRYWQLDFSSSVQFTDIYECAEEVKRCFDETVSLMCNCDVPIGAALSGGLDSSAIVSSMTRSIDTFPTFRISAGPGDHAGEFDSARKVSERFQTDHHEYTIAPRDMLLFEKVIQSHGEPIVSSVPIDAYLLAKKMKKHVTVALSGAGSDELFGGYPLHHELSSLDRHFSRFRKLEKTAQGQNCMETFDPDAKNAWDIYRKVGNNHPENYFGFMRSHDDGVYEKIYSPQMFQAAMANDPAKICAQAFTGCNATSLFNGFMGQQLHCVSQYSTAEINDRTAMAHSLEIRSPFLDVQMVELACRIPTQFKIGHDRNGPVHKNVLKLAMKDRLPAQTITCPKLPFGGTTPYQQWFMGECSDFFDDKLQSQALADSGLFDMRGIAELQLLYDCGADIPWNPLLGVIATAIWLENFF